jgi:subtilisin-like proprotein convertase family protein
LVGYWRFDEGTGSTAADASGNGNNGTVNGASWVTSDAPISALQATDIRWHEVTGNGNGLIDPGESIALEVDVSSGLDATNMSGTLAVTGGSVTLSHDSSSYPDLVAGATVSNSTPYTFVVDPSCAGDLTFTLTVTYNTNQTTQTAILPLIIPAGLAFGQQHAYTGSAIAIPDDNATGAIASIEIATGGRVADVDVHVEASHPYDADLALYLIAPSGTIVELSSENGGDGDDYSGTIFDDDASTPISSGSVPFTGRFQPEEALTLLNGEPVSGTWQLKVVDDTFGGEGTLTGFALDIQTVSYLCLAASADSPTILGSPTQFTASARVPVNTIEWDFADGSPSVISTLPLSHTYAAVGNYSASATAFLFGQPGTTVDMEVSIVPTTTDVRITNLRDASLTISWLTDLATSGEVHYGTNPSNLNQTVQDERGASTSDDTHFVTLLSLLPNTTYYFDVLSAGVTDDNHGSHYTVTTAPTLELPGNDQIYGQVFLTDSTPAAGTIVYITLEDKNSVGTPGAAAPLSALVDESGYWFFNLADARSADLSSYFSYSSSGDRLRLEAKGAGDGRGCQIVETSADSPAEAIVLSLSPCTTTWEIDLDASWNHISLPLAPLVAYSAESVCDEIDAQGGNTAEIDRWHNGGWDGHICQLTFNDYPLALASSDFIKSNTPTTWIIEGVEVSVPVPLDIQVGWNSIGIPHTDAYSAESLCQEIIDQGVTAVEIDRWYASGWSGHICGLPFNDFNIERGVGYFVKASSSGTVTPSEPATSLQQLVQAEERGAEVLLTLPTGPSLPVQDWQLGNWRDTSVTFSWLTEAATTSYLRFGEVADQLEQVATDSRGADMSSTTHVVVLNHLEPETTYHFEIISGQEVAERGSFTTAPSMESVPESDTIYGRVYQADGERAASGALVYLTLRDADGEGSRGEAALLLATVDASGYWQANLGNARTSDLSGSFSYAATDVVVMTAQGTAHEHETASQTVELANTPQAPDLILQSSPTAVTLNDLSSDLPVSSKWLLTLAALTLLAGVLLARRIK